MAHLNNSRFFDRKVQVNCKQYNTFKLTESLFLIDWPHIIVKGDSLLETTVLIISTVGILFGEVQVPSPVSQKMYKKDPIFPLKEPPY